VGGCQPGCDLMDSGGGQGRGNSNPALALLGNRSFRYNPSID
jgi:hypothetical protein